MAARAIADLTLSFGLVSIPVRLYPATQSGKEIHFNLLHKTCGSRLKQQYLCIKENVVVERSEMVKGYEFADDQYVVFSPDELKALEEAGTHTIDIVAFIPQDAIDPLYFDRAYFLTPDKRGGRPYALLMQGMLSTGRCALARWTWRGKSYTVQVRVSGDGGLVLQQLLYADEVRSIRDLDIETAEVKEPELKLAVQLIEQIAQDSFDPKEYKNTFQERVGAAVDEKIQGKEVTISSEPEAGTGKVIDLMEALRSSLVKRPAAPSAATAAVAPARKAARKSAAKAEDAGTSKSSSQAAPPKKRARSA